MKKQTNEYHDADGNAILLQYISCVYSFHWK